MSPEAEQLRAGAAEVDITPPAGLRMQGYELRHAEGITDPLFVSALAVGSERVEWLLLSVDCIGLDRSFTGPLRSKLARSLSVPASVISIACSHTHSGPATLSRLGQVEAEQDYLLFLERQLIAAAETAARNLEDVRWRLGVASLRENINRRVKRNGRVELGADPAGPLDDRLRVIRLDRAADPQGAPLALVAHYSCHATASGGVPRISADWPGTMRTVLQAVYSADSPPVVCFLQGCAGDVTHRIARDRDAWPEHFGRHTAVQSEILGRLSAAAAVTASERAVGWEAETVTATTTPLKLRYHRDRGGEETEAQVVRIGARANGARTPGPSVWVVGLPGEPFTTYSTGLGERLCREVGATNDNVLVFGYNNDVVGYLTTPEALRQGGYEVSRAYSMYHRPAPFSAATQPLVFDQIVRAASQLVNGHSSSRIRFASALGRLADRLSGRF